MQRAAYILPNLRACYINVKDKVDFSTTEQLSQDPFLASPLVKGKSGTSSCFRKMPFQSLHVQHVSLLLLSGGDFQAATLKCGVKKEQEIF